MKIAIIHHQYAKKGGLESDLLNLIDMLSLNGDQVTLFTRLIDQNLLKEKPCNIVQYKSCAKLPKIFRKFFFIHYINQNFNPKEFDLSISFTRTANQDIVICGGTHLGYLRKIGNFLSYLNPRHLLEIYHDKNAFLKSKVIIAHSQAIANEIQTLYNIPKEKIHQVYPLINREQFVYVNPKKKIEFAKKFNIDPTKTTLLFPSTGHKRKGLPELLKAMALLKKENIELIVAGKPIKVRKKIHKNVKSIGFVKEMPDLYGAVDFTILPAHHEPFGLVVIESIQCGTPVIISKEVGAKELISSNEGIILDSLTPIQIANTIKEAKKMKFYLRPDFVKHNKKLDPKNYLLTVKKSVNK